MISVAAVLKSDRFGVLSAAQAAAVAAVRQATGFAVEAEWKADVRVDTGNYRRSIHTDHGPTRTVVSSNVDYAGFNEWGTSRMAARPSATKAGENQRRLYTDRCRRAIGAVR